VKEKKQNAQASHTGRHKQSHAVINRLSRIEGHVRAVKRMVEEEIPCPDVLIQLAAIKSAIQRTAQIVLEDHMESCLSEAAKKGETDLEWDSMKEALHKYIS
jgi:CsoR family transcriptional regulator, copper-sensing transcriptional repressor